MATATSFASPQKNGDKSSNSQNTHYKECDKNKVSQWMILFQDQKNLAAKCQFCHNTKVEDRVLNQLIWGSRNPDVQNSLISQDKSLTLAAAMRLQGARWGQVNT